MATTRKTGGHASNMQQAFRNYLQEFNSQYDLYTVTRTKDSYERVVSSTETPVTIYADIQWVTKRDLDRINSGDIKVGDGMLFVEADVDINLETDDVLYEVDVSGIRWRVITEIEGEVVEGELPYRGFAIRRV